MQGRQHRARHSDSIVAPEQADIDLVLKADKDKNGSWISLGKDGKGRLLLGGQNRQPITRLTIDAAPLATMVSWDPAPEKGIASYVVAYGPPADPLRHLITVLQPHASLPPLAAGTLVSVKAVNARGLEGWDWARAVAGRGAPRSTTTP